jgi:hypothetical protein
MYGKVMCLAAISSDDPVSPLHKIILPFIIVLKTSEDGKKEVYLYLSWLDRKGWAFRFISLLATKRTASYISSTLVLLCSKNGDCISVSPKEDSSGYLAAIGHYVRGDQYLTHGKRNIPETPDYSSPFPFLTSPFQFLNIEKEDSPFK